METSDNHSTKELKDSLKVFIDLMKEMHGVEPRYGKECPVVEGPSYYAIWQYSENGVIDDDDFDVELIYF